MAASAMFEFTFTSNFLLLISTLLSFSGLNDSGATLEKEFRGGRGVVLNGAKPVFLRQRVFE